MPPLVAWHDRAYVSVWSITHFLYGYWWSLAWSYSFSDALPWLNLLLITTGACLFELFENTPQGRAWMWSWLGYDDTSYPGDSLQNAVSDVVFTLIGWLTVRVVVTYTMSTAALVVMLGVSAVLAVVFYPLMRIEQRIQGVGVAEDKTPPASQLPPLMLEQ